MGLWNDIAGTADHLAGSTDEAVARSTDDQAGGGVVDGFAGTVDHLAGSTDESVGRQFDDTQGGGFADYDTYAGIADHAAGSTDEWVGNNTPQLKLYTGIVVLIVVLYLAKPILETGANLSE